MVSPFTWPRLSHGVRSNPPTGRASRRGSSEPGPLDVSIPGPSASAPSPLVCHPTAVEVGHGADEYAAPCRVVLVLGGDDGVGGSVEPLRVEQRREPSREAGLGAVAGGDLAGVAVAAAVEAAGDRVP